MFRINLGGSLSALTGSAEDPWRFLHALPRLPRCICDTPPRSLNDSWLFLPWLRLLPMCCWNGKNGGQKQSSAENHLADEYATALACCKSVLLRQHCGRMNILRLSLLLAAAVMSFGAAKKPVVAVRFHVEAKAQDSASFATPIKFSHPPREGHIER